MKKISLYFLVLAVVGVAFLFTFKAKHIKVVSSSADFSVVYTDLSMLEEISDNIVEVSYDGVTEITPFPASGDPDMIVNLSQILVEKTHKGVLKESTKIWISEPGAVVGNRYETTEGYVQMNKEGRYLVFLEEFPIKIDGKTVYSIIGAHQGKYDLTSNKPVENLINPSYRQVIETEYFGDLSEQFNSIKNQVLEKYATNS